MQAQETSDEKIQAGRRAHSRARLLLPGKIVLLDGTYKCLIEDLSVSGARAVTDAEAVVGICGVLQCENLEGFGTIRWATGGRFGIEFDQKQPLDIVVGLRWYSDNRHYSERAELERYVEGWVSGTYRV